MWTLEPNGVRVPRQRQWTRNGLPDEARSITALAFDVPVPDSAFAIDSATQAMFVARHRRSLDEAVLHGERAQDVAPGVVLLPGAWNVSLIVQPDGILVLEAPISSGYSRQALAEVARGR